MTDENTPIEHKLARDGTLFENIEILNTKVEPTVGNEDWHVRIELQLDEDLVATCAFGFLYVIGVLSFHDRRPRGASGIWFEDEDQFTAGA